MDTPIDPALSPAATIAASTPPAKHLHITIKDLNTGEEKSFSGAPIAEIETWLRGRTATEAELSP